MALVVAKCTSCGSNIEVDPGKEAGICPYCGSAFIVEKAINNYITNTTTNIEKQTNIYFSDNIFEKEKRECKLLLMLLNKMDLQYLKEQALKVLSVNPDNSLAQTIYDCDFTVEYYNAYTFLEFDEQPLHKYLEKEYGKIDAETSITFIKALLCKVSNDTNVANLVKLVFKNLSELNLDSNTVYVTYKNIATLIGDVDRINNILYASKLSKTVGFLSFLDDSSNVGNAFNDASEKKKVALSMLESRKVIAHTFTDIIRSSQLTETQKGEIASIIRLFTDDNSQNNNTSVETSKKKSGKIKGVGIGMTILGACNLFVALFLETGLTTLIGGIFLLILGICMMKA